MGFATSPETRDTLAGYGIRVTGYRWRWALGLKGGTFPPHYHQNNERVTDVGDFAALPGEETADEAADVKLSEIEGMSPATVAVLEEGGYRTLNDIIDLEREDLLRLPGIAPEEADRIIAMLDELTEDGGDDGADDGAGGKES